MSSRFRLSGLLSLLAAVALLMVAPAQAQRRGADQWVKLGEQSVGFSVDRDVIQLGRDDGRFRAIKLLVKRNDVFILDVRATYRSGEQQDLVVRQPIRAGSETPALQLAASPRGDNGRVIQQIEFIYKSRPGFGDQAIVEVWGLRAADGGGGGGYGAWGGPPPNRIYAGDVPRGWVQFGSQTVGFQAERDVIRLGRDVGRFHKIALRVLRNDIWLREITINYARGDKDRIPVNAEISANGLTQPIAMKRDGRLESIEFVYQARPGFRGGQAVIKVYGEYADNWVGGEGGNRPGHGQWLLLGAQRADMLNEDRDAFEVGRRLGSFRSIKLKALKHAVLIRNVRIIYGNGETEDVQAPRELFGGQESAPIDLRGRERFIERIELSYRTKLNFKGDAIVEIYGLH